jgi:ceramide glucosyltransferase
VELASTPVWMVYPHETLSEFLRHELRWIIGLRNVRPGGHAAMAFTFGLLWTTLAAAVSPSVTLAGLYVTSYLVLRSAVYLTLGAWGLRDPVARRAWWLAPLRDAASLAVWLVSFFSDRICWRGLEFQVKRGLLIPARAAAISSAKRQRRTGEVLE